MGHASPRTHTNTRVNNETWRRELCQYLKAARGGGVLIEGDDAVLRWGDEVVEIGRLQHRREPARRHRRPAGRHPNRFPDYLGLGVVFSASEITEINQSALGILGTGGGRRGCRPRRIAPRRGGRRRLLPL